MIKRLWYWFNNLSIKYKLLSSYLFLIVIPLGLFLLVNTVITSNETERQALSTARRLLSQTKSFLELKTATVRNTLNNIALNDTVKEIVSRHPQVYRRDIGLWSVDATRLNRVFLTYKSNTAIANIQLYMKSGLALVFQNEDFKDLNQVKVTTAPWYQQLLSGADLLRWYPKEYFSSSNGEKYLYALRKISSEQDLMESIGVIKADVPLQDFQSILDQAVYTKATATLLVNENLEIICTSTGSRYQTSQSIAPILAGLKTKVFEGSYWQKMNLRNEKLLVGLDNITKSDWILLMVIPYRDILALSVQSNQRMLLIFILITLATIPLAFLIAASATHRLQSLTLQIRNVETGKNAVTVPTKGNDEIDVLTRNFNNMLMRITALMEEKYRLGQEIKSLELKALQAQINPHFLYNTLDLINWMAVRTKTPEISRVVEALSQFYRLSLNKGEDTVTIASELKQVQAYVKIQNMRFNNCIRLSITVPPEIQACKILKLILQPLVENSIQHGILEKDQETGTIQIQGSIEAGTIRLAVIDDGVGMTPEQTARILTEGGGSGPNGYGVKNIHERLKLNYGEAYGLSYQSKPGKGTRAIITIPAPK
ncbi:MAG TPA: sensor histidine kinase [Bacillota bacterium]